SLAGGEVLVEVLPGRPPALRERAAAVARRKGATAPAGARAVAGVAVPVVGLGRAAVVLGGVRPVGVGGGEGGSHVGWSGRLRARRLGRGGGGLRRGVLGAGVSATVVRGGGIVPGARVQGFHVRRRRAAGDL